MNRSRWLSVITLSGTLVTARTAGAMPPPPPRCPLEQRIESLDVDPATRDKLYAALDAGELEHKKTERELREAHRQMHSLLEDATATEDAIRAQAKRVDDLERQSHTQRLETLLAVRALLPAAQRGSLAPPEPPRRDPEGDAPSDRRSGGPGRGDGRPDGHAEGHGARGPERGRQPAGHEDAE